MGILQGTRTVIFLSECESKSGSGSGCLQLNTPSGERRAGCGVRMKNLLIGNTSVVVP